MTHLSTALAELMAERGDVDAELVEAASVLEHLEDRRRLLEMAITAIGDIGPEPTPARAVNTTRRAPVAPRSNGHQRRPLGGKYDYAEIAELCCNAIELGESPRRALVAFYGDVSMDTAGYLVRTARERGHDIPHVAGGTKRGRPPKPKVAAVPPPPVAVASVVELVPDPEPDPEPPPDVSPDLVALTYLQAVRDNRHPVQAIMDFLDCTKPSAVALIANARQVGALPPRDAPQLPDDERRELLDAAATVGVGPSRRSQ